MPTPSKPIKFAVFAYFPDDWDQLMKELDFEERHHGRKFYRPWAHVRAQFHEQQGTKCDQQRAMNNKWFIWRQVRLTFDLPGSPTPFELVERNLPSREILTRASFCAVLQSDGKILGIAKNRNHTFEDVERPEQPMPDNEIVNFVVPESLKLWDVNQTDLDLDKLVCDLGQFDALWTGSRLTWKGTKDHFAIAHPDLKLAYGNQVRAGTLVIFMDERSKKRGCFTPKRPNAETVNNQ